MLLVSTKLVVQAVTTYEWGQRKKDVNSFSTGLAMKGGKKERCFLRRNCELSDEELRVTTTLLQEACSCHQSLHCILRAGLASFVCTAEVISSPSIYRPGKFCFVFEPDYEK